MRPWLTCPLMTAPLTLLWQLLHHLRMLLLLQLPKF
jgi:hypothetical protein